MSIFGDWQPNLDPLTLGLLGMAAGFGQAPRGVGNTLGAGFGGLAQGLTMGQKMQIMQMDEARKRREEAAAARMAPIQEEAMRRAFEPPPWQGGTAPMGVPAAADPSPATGGYVDSMIRLESGGDPSARNPRSSATGAGQFINSTWLDLLRRRKPELASARNDEFLLSLRADPALSREMVAAYGEENGARLKAAGLPDTPGTRGLAHRFGPDGAATLLRADPAAPVDALVGPAVMEANPDLRGKTAGEVAGFYRERLGGGEQAGATQQPAWGPVERARWYMDQATAMAFVKPELATQYREMAKMEMERGRKQLTTVGGRTAERDLVTGGVQFHDEPVERVTDAQGRARITPRAAAVGASSYGEAPSGYQWVTDPAGNITGMRALPGGPAEFVIQEVMGPDGRMTRYAIPRTSLTAPPASAGGGGQASAPAAPTAPAQAATAPPVPTAPDTPAPPSGSILAPPARQAAALPPGTIALPSGSPNNNPAGLESGTKKEIEGALLESQNAIAGMNRVREQFRPEFLQTTTRLGNWWQSLRDRTPEVFGRLDEKRRAELEDFTRFRASAWQDLNQIIKDQSGAAVTVPEMERMLRARPNPGTGVFDGDSPTEFKAKMDEVLEIKRRAVLRNVWAAKRGVNPLESGVGLDDVPRLINDLLNEAAQAIAAANPRMSREEIKAAAQRQVGQSLGVGAIR